MDNPISKESNSSIAMNKLKLSEDASKIVRAIKKLHVPNTTLTDSNDLGNGKRTLKLVNGIQLSCNIDKVKEEKANNEKVMTKNKNVLTVYQPSNKNTGKESVVEEDNVDVEKSDCHEKKDVISSEKNGIRKEDPDNQNNSSGSIEQQTLDQVVSGNSLKINTQKPAQINNSRTIVKPVKSSNGSDSCISERKEIVDDKCGNVSKLKEENCTRNPCDISSLTSLKCNSPVVFESTAKEEGMQKAVNKVVEKLLNELPTSDDTNVEEVKKFNGGDCRLYTELTKDSDSNKRIKYDSENEDGTPCAKTIEDKETNTHCELRMKIDLKRKQANYIDADEKTVDMITVKKVKIDSEVITDEGRKLACSIKNGKLLDTKDDEKIKDIKEDDKVKITRFSHKDIIAEVEKLARSLLTKQTRSEVGELRAKVLALEKKVDYWKRQCWHLQKEMTECNIGVQRANQNLKKNTSVMPIKISTRSVGLQVQQVQQVQHVQMGVVRAPTASIAPAPLPAVRRHDVIQPAKTVAAAIPPTVTPKLHPSVSVSILQPKPPNNIASNLLMTPITSPGNTVIPKVASVIAPTTVATVRSALDLQRKVQVVVEEEDVKRETAKTVSTSRKQDTPQGSALDSSESNVTQFQDRSMHEKAIVIKPNSLTRSKLRRPIEIRHQIDVRKQPLIKHRAQLSTQPSAHTLNLTAAALRIFRRFLVSVGEVREIIALSTTKLNSYMARFFATGKKKDGSEYGANTLTCVFDSIERHLRMHNYPASVKKDEIFHTARENLRLKRRQLQKKKQNVKCITYYENGKFRTRSWNEFTETVPLGPLPVKKNESLLSNADSIDDIKLFTSWKNGAPLNDLRALFHLDVYTLNAYLAQFFIWVRKDEKGEAINSSRLQRFHNTLDAYMSELSYPISVKSNIFFRHSLECKGLKEKFLDGHLEGEFVKQKKNDVIGRSQVEDNVDQSDNEDTFPLSSVFEPEVSLVEDDNEIVLDLDNCKTSTSDGCTPVSGMLKTFLDCSEMKEKGNIVKIPPDSLDHLLANFYVNCAIDMDAIELTDFHESISKYLSESGYPLSIEDDPDFVYSQLCLSSRQAFLLRITELPQNMFISQMNCLSQLGAVGITDPVALLSCLWCHITHEYHIGTAAEHAQLQWNQVQLKKDSSNNDYLEYKSKILKKVDTEFSNICPVEAYKILMKYRPCITSEKCNGCNNFYLCVSSDYSWFNCKELVKGQLELIAKYVDDVMVVMKNRSGAELEVSNLKMELFNKLQSEQKVNVAEATRKNESGKELSDQKVKEVFVAGGHAPNTIIKTMHDVNVFRDWLSSNGLQRNFASVSASTLNKMLLKFFANLKKRDGSDYEPNSLNSIYFSIDRYLRVQQYPANIKSDSAFLECRNFFSVKRKEYDADKDPVHIVQRRQVDISFTDDDIECLRKKKLLGPFNPEAMLLALWHMNTVTLGIHSQRAQLHMLWGDFQLLKDSDGREFVEYHQCATKAKLISCSPNGMSSLINKRPLKAYATPHKLESCPVELFKKFRQCRPPSLLIGDSRFYLYPTDSNCTFWFRDSPLGRSKFASLPATIWKLIHEAREELKMKIPSESKQITGSVITKQDTKQQPLTSEATKLKCQNSPSISLIPLFPTKSPVKKTEQTSSMQNIIPTQNVVLFPVVSAPTTANVVQIIPLISTMTSHQQHQNSTLFITSDKL